MAHNSPVPESFGAGTHYNRVNLRIDFYYPIEIYGGHR